jgi:hypothetical protein
MLAADINDLITRTGPGTALRQADAQLLATRRPVR